MSSWYKHYFATHYQIAKKKMEVDFVVDLLPPDGNKERTNSHNSNDDITVTSQTDYAEQTTDAGNNSDNNNDDAPKLSYANVTKGRKEQDGDVRKVKQSSIERKERIFTIYRLATVIPSEATIARAIGVLFEKEPREVVEKVQRDTRYRSRYNILFKEKEDCQYIIRNGITIEGQKIGGRKGNYIYSRPITHIYIPNFPASGTKDELFTLLSSHLTVAYLKERVHRDLGIAIGGWNAGVYRELGHSIPDTIIYEDQTYDVIYPGKTRREKHSPQVSEEENNYSDTDWSKPVFGSRPLNNQELKDFIHKNNLSTVEKDLEMSETEEDEEEEKKMEISEKQMDKVSNEIAEESQIEEKEEKFEKTIMDKDGFTKVRSKTFKRRKKKKPPQVLAEKQKESIALFTTPKDFVVPEMIKSQGKESSCLENNISEIT